MNKLLYSVMILFFTTGLSLGTYAQDKSDDTKNGPKTEQKSEEKMAKKDSKPFNVVCPVSGEEADPEVTYEYKGVVYATCCNNCMKKFKKDPEKYISRLSEDGKSIKKKK